MWCHLLFHAVTFTALTFCSTCFTLVYSESSTIKWMNILSLYLQFSRLSCCKLRNVLFSIHKFILPNYTFTVWLFWPFLFAFLFALFSSSISPHKVMRHIDCYRDLLCCSGEGRSHTWCFLFSLCPDGPIDWLIEYSVYSVLSFFWRMPYEMTVSASDSYMSNVRTHFGCLFTETDAVIPTLCSIKSSSMWKFSPHTGD